MMEAHTKIYGRERTNFGYINYLHLKPRVELGDPIFFLHGLGYNPKYYERLLEKFAEYHEVFAPHAYGVNRLNPQPTTIEQYVEFSLEFSQRMHPGARVHFIGHSLGGGIAIASASQSSEISDVVALSPMLPINSVLPVNFKPLEFIPRAIYKRTRELLGISSEEGQSSREFAVRMTPEYIANIFNDIKSSYALISIICSFQYQNISLSQPLLVLQADQDEFFKLNKRNREILESVGKNLEIKTLRDKNHDWPILWPTQAYEEAISFIDAQKQKAVK